MSFEFRHSGSSRHQISLQTRSRNIVHLLLFFLTTMCQSSFHESTYLTKLKFPVKRTEPPPALSDPSENKNQNQTGKKRKQIHFRTPHAKVQKTDHPQATCLSWKWRVIFGALGKVNSFTCRFECTIRVSLGDGWGSRGRPGRRTRFVPLFRRLSAPQFCRSCLHLCSFPAATCNLSLLSPA